MPSLPCDAEHVRQIACVEEVHALLGQGSFSKVYRCSIAGWEEEVALKVLDPTMSVSEWLKAEVDPMETRNHPYLVSLLRVLEGPPDCLIFELCRGGTLQRSLQQAPPGVWSKVETAQKVRGAWQVASAIEYLHSLDIIHRSLNPANVFLMEPVLGTEVVSMPTMKLGDLRLTRYVRGPLNQQPMTRCIGVPAYMAPEVLTEDNYGLRADVFSFSMLLFELISGEEPYGTVHDVEGDHGPGDVRLVLKILEGHRPSLDALSGDGIMSDLSSLLVACWDADPGLRPSAAELAARLKNMAEAAGVCCHFPKVGSRASEAHVFKQRR
eukprot:TRINITY_DN11323_c0_g1_i5.p1 TRINITY_DN11323_c0_g1~~TRINITY_DN11323_c0_g1_i5.p1  ORF type:complete len:324 (+),score=48.02 TRINITY_DN11323_c0_g1_i5:15-986(+)